jgi:hypothetical protein
MNRRVEGCSSLYFWLGSFRRSNGSTSSERPYSGTIEKVDENDLTIKARDSQNVVVKFSDTARILAFVETSLEDIKPNS